MCLILLNGDLLTPINKPSLKVLDTLSRHALVIVFVRILGRTGARIGILVLQLAQILDA